MSLTVKVGVNRNGPPVSGVSIRRRPSAGGHTAVIFGRKAVGVFPSSVWFFSQDKYRKIFMTRDSVLSRSMSLRSDNSVSSIRGVGPELADRLSTELGVETIDDLDDCDPADLVRLDGVGMTTFARLVAGEPERRL